MAIPSRMTIGQLIEGLAGKLAGITGITADATIFRDIDLQAIGDELEKRGFDRHGTEHCYDGRTGEFIDRELFISLNYYQRLQKFVVEEVYSISTGPTCIIKRGDCWQVIAGRSLYSYDQEYNRRNVQIAGTSCFNN